MMVALVSAKKWGVYIFYTPYMKKRSPADSRLDPEKTNAEQFDLLRVVYSQRYPAFFNYHGKRYVVKIEKEVNE